MIPYRTISFQDLRHLGFDLDYKEKEKDNGTLVANRVRLRRHSIVMEQDKFLELLWNLGCDVKRSRYGVTKKIRHRCETRKEPIVDHMFVCLERTDIEWSRSGLASPEAFAASSVMTDMARSIREDF